MDVLLPPGETIGLMLRLEVHGEMGNLHFLDPLDAGAQETQTPCTKVRGKQVSGFGSEATNTRIFDLA